MAVVIGVRGFGGGGAVAYEVVHLEVVGYQCGVYQEPPNL